jgi:hypothetical protein
MNITQGTVDFSTTILLDRATAAMRLVADSMYVRSAAAPPPIVPQSEQEAETE